MNFKEYLINHSLESLPHDISKIVAQDVYTVFIQTLDCWHENFLGDYTFSSPYDAFVSFREILINNPPKLKAIMHIWWTLRSASDICKGELLSREITDFYREYKCDTPLGDVPHFDRESFSALFEGEILPPIQPNFEDFFNSDNKTRVKHENLSRTKNFPYSLSKKRIVNKFTKNSYFIEMHIRYIVENYLETCDFGGKSWSEYIIELVSDRICNQY